MRRRVEGREGKEEILCGFASMDVNKQLAKASLFDTCDIARFGVWQVCFCEIVDRIGY